MSACRGRSVAFHHSLLVGMIISGLAWVTLLVRVHLKEVLSVAWHIIHKLFD